jgi:hypothetical protein
MFAEQDWKGFRTEITLAPFLIAGKLLVHLGTAGETMGDALPVVADFAVNGVEQIRRKL